MKNKRRQKPNIGVFHKVEVPTRSLGVWVYEPHPSEQDKPRTTSGIKYGSVVLV